MPEIGEVARIVHHLRRHVVGRVVAAVRTQEDPIVYGKVGTSAAQFEEAVKGKTIRGAHQQGKYFWLEMSSPPHPLMHFGMTGWIHFSDDDARPYKATKKRKISGLDGDEVADDRVWPPNFWKFNLAFEAEGKEDKHAAGADNVAVRPACEVAFVDSRRLARVRLVDVAGDLMRKTPPLSNNGPDPVLDRDLLNVDWLAKLLRKKKVPIKALLLDQGNISGIGNWVADEILYQARIHPNQYSNTFNQDRVKKLHDALMHVCHTAVDTLAESEKFPSTWLMKYRWSKGNKNSPSVLPNGDKIIFLTVGGRTSAVVPSVQKVTGQIAEIAEAAEISQSEEDAVNNDKVGEVVSPKKPKGKRTKQESKSERKGSWPLRAKTIPKEAPTAEKSTKLILSASEDEEDEDEREEDYSPGRKRSRV